MMRQRQTPYNFSIVSNGKLSSFFRARGLNDFQAACDFVRDLPYGRNADRSDPLTVLRERRGTCGTKHALLKRLADENGAGDCRLVIGMYRMTAENTPAVAGILEDNGLDCIPEAHNYLLTAGTRLDCTRSGMDVNDFIDDVISEIEIQPEQITEFKISYHQRWLEQWIIEKQLKITAGALWTVREKC